MQFYKLFLTAAIIPLVMGNISAMDFILLQALMVLLSVDW